MAVNKRSTKELIIVCEDSYGLDVYTIVEAINDKAVESGAVHYQVAGFIGERLDALGTPNPPAPMLGMIAEWRPRGNEVYAMGIRDPFNKERAAKMLEGKGAVFETLIAPWCLLPPSFSAGKGCIIANYNCKYGSRFGDFVTVDLAMCESVEVGDYSTLCPFVNITDARIGERVFVGCHAAVMMKRIVDDESVVGPGSIVLTSVKARSEVAGVPARRGRSYSPQAKDCR